MKGLSIIGLSACFRVQRHPSHMRKRERGGDAGEGGTRHLRPHVTVRARWAEYPGEHCVAIGRAREEAATPEPPAPCASAATGMRRRGSVLGGRGTPPAPPREGCAPRPIARRCNARSRNIAGGGTRRRFSPNITALASALRDARKEPARDLVNSGWRRPAHQRCSTKRRDASKVPAFPKRPERSQLERSQRAGVRYSSAPTARCPLRRRTALRLWSRRRDQQLDAEHRER